MEATRDHVPAKVLIDKPYPDDLPVVASCFGCNNRASEDELYVAALVDCARTGWRSDQDLRPRIAAALVRNPALRRRLCAARRVVSCSVRWAVEFEPLVRFVTKLARGHAAYEYGVPELEEPEHIFCQPFEVMTTDEIARFESIERETIWPEVGCRAFRDTAIAWSLPFMGSEGWKVLQPKRYRYAVSHSWGTRVRVVLSEYLACEVSWS